MSYIQVKLRPRRSVLVRRGMEIVIVRLLGPFPLVTDESLAINNDNHFRDVLREQH
jgi:hypothetical protein